VDEGTMNIVNTLQIYAQDPRNKDIENVLILSGDQLYRMDYMDLVQVPNCFLPK